MISIDWSMTKPLCLYDGTNIKFVRIDKENRNKSLEEIYEIIGNDKTVVAENLPYLYQRFMHSSGIKMFLIHPTRVKEYTESSGIRNNSDYEEKSDEYDAKAIHNLFLTKPELFTEVKFNQELDRLRVIMSNWEDIEKLRIRIGNRQFAQGEKTSVKDLEIMETKFVKEIEAILPKFPIYNEFFEKIKGCGTRISSHFITYIDIRKAHNPSAILKYCGMGVTDGKADGKKSGRTLGYNPKLKTICYLLGEQIVRQRTPKYRELYDRAKERYSNHEKHKDKSKLQIERMSRRIAVKQFLVDLYYNWRRIEGLPVVDPYPMKMLGHVHFITPDPTKLEVINMT